MDLFDKCSSLDDPLWERYKIMKKTAIQNFGAQFFTCSLLLEYFEGQLENLLNKATNKETVEKKTIAMKKYHLSRGCKMCEIDSLLNTTKDVSRLRSLHYFLCKEFNDVIPDCGCEEALETLALRNALEHDFSIDNVTS